MNELTEKIAQVEAEISKERGPFKLFAIFEREDLFNRWDVVISARWAGVDKQESLNYLSAELKRVLNPADLTAVSRIVMLQPSDEPVRAITDAIDVEHGRVEIDETNQFGLPIRHGYVITSKRAA